MRYLAQLLLCCLLALPAASRSGGGSHGGGGGVRGGVSGGGFRGYGGGFRGYGGLRYGVYGRNRFYFGAGYGYWPWWYSSPYYDYGYPDYSYPDSNYDYGDQPPIVVYPPDPPPGTAYAPPPPVRPEMHEYLETPPSQGQDYERPIYLIAFKGQDNIRAAEAYWIEGNTLHYVNLQHEQKQTPLDSVDRAFSERLNRGRRVDFRLPPTP
jgi:hypothetical protein